mgnify:CR=1 FL=1
MSDRGKRFSIHTLGCKVNLYQSEGIARMLEEEGYIRAGPDQDPDILLVNTCTVTEKAAGKSKSLIRSLKRQFPGSTTVALGCYSAYDRDDLEALEEADIVLAYEDKYDIPGALQGGAGASAHTAFPFTVDHIASRTRGLIMVQDGCDSYCSYCILPYIRGPLRSRDPEDITAEARAQISNGCRELVITGIHTGAYGRDLDGAASICDIVERIASLDGDFRIRLSSIEIGEIDRHLTELIRDNDRVCPHLPVPLQSGSDRILRLMNRKYTAEEFIRRIREIRQEIPLCACTTDIMCGFPGETEDDFKDTVRTAERIGFSRIHAFPYSVRKGTKAAGMGPRVPPQVKKERVRKLIDIGDRLAHKYADGLAGSSVTVLPETYAGESGILRGYCEYYIPVEFRGEQNLVGELTEVEAVKQEDGELRGEM